jgi:imidazole glycerol-phosphate synthase subunit HisH
MIAIIDYGMGNLRSVQKALERVGTNAIITQKASEVSKADKIVLPGVGAIEPAMKKLGELGLVNAIKENIRKGKPFLGICLGFQLLFEYSQEGGRIPALGILKGDVIRFNSLKVPHMGWNQITLRQRNCPLFHQVPQDANGYFCHSYYAHPSEKDTIAATTTYGVTFASAVAYKNIFGVQFHPEKSQTIGLQILKNFLEMKP